jgi:hypothetical protein
VNWAIIVSETRLDNSNHTKKAGEAMMSIENERIEAVARKAKAIRDVLLREREEARALQLSANAEVRRGWKESDNWGDTKSVSMPQSLSLGR